MPDDQFHGSDVEPTIKSPEDANAAGNPADRMLAQLQSMIDSIATQAAPVVRQVGAKAAELAAATADRAGPIAHRPPTQRPGPASRSPSGPASSPPTCAATPTVTPERQSPNR